MNEAQNPGDAGHRSPGRIMLVGIGPGSVEHMTLRARAAIAEADVVIGYVTYIKLVADKKAVYVKLDKLQTDYYSKLSKSFAVKEQDKYIAEGNANDYRAFQRTFEQNLARARVGVHCKDDPQCYVKYVEKSADDIAKDVKAFIPDIDKWEKEEKQNLQIAAAERALLELAKMGPKAAGTLDQLLKLLPSKERIVRQGALMALVHASPKPCTRCVEVLDMVIAEQENQSTLNALTQDARVWRYYFKWAQ